TTPASAWHHAELAADAGADLLLVQSQVSSARHISTSGRVLSLADLTGGLRMPVLVGNTVSGAAAYQLMHHGAEAVLVGVGPGAAGIGGWVPHRHPFRAVRAFGSARSCPSGGAASGRRRPATGRKTWWARCASRWPPSARAPSPRCTKSRW